MQKQSTITNLYCVLMNCWIDWSRQNFCYILDKKSCYNQITLEKNSAPLTEFVTSNGQYIVHLLVLKKTGIWRRSTQISVTLICRNVPPRLWGSRRKSEGIELKSIDSVRRDNRSHDHKSKSQKILTKRENFDDENEDTERKLHRPLRFEKKKKKSLRYKFITE